MSLIRVLETEVMDSLDEARDYDSMDHSEVNRSFVAELIEFAEGSLEHVLDVGAGTALIPIELCRQHARCQVTAIDMALPMLELARKNISAAGLSHRILLDQADAKGMPYASGRFDSVMSNSIVHHIPEPLECLAEMVRVVSPGGLLFVRDLMRPNNDQQVHQLVHIYAGLENCHCQQMYEDSLRAALTVNEMRQWVAELGFGPDTVSVSSDRHWTWAARKPLS